MMVIRAAIQTARRPWRSGSEAVPGAASYDVYRISGGSSNGFLLNVLGTTLNDTGLSAGAMPGTTNTTGRVTVDDFLGINTSLCFALDSSLKVLGGSVHVTSLGIPVVSMITRNGSHGGSTPYGYSLVARDALNVPTPQGAPLTIPNGYPTLDPLTNNNTITWSAVPGAASYDVYRVLGPPGQGFIGNTTLLTLNDVGQAASTLTPATANLTAKVLVDTQIGVNTQSPNAGLQVVGGGIVLSKLGDLNSVTPTVALYCLKS